MNFEARVLLREDSPWCNFMSNLMPMGIEIYGNNYFHEKIQLQISEEAHLDGHNFKENGTHFILITTKPMKCVLNSNVKHIQL